MERACAPPAPIAIRAAASGAADARQKSLCELNSGSTLPLYTWLASAKAPIIGDKPCQNIRQIAHLLDLLPFFNLV
jgi:hypothetical protein